MSESRAYMNSYTVAARRKGIMLKDLIILISDEVRCSVSELSRALNAKEAEKHLEPKQEKIVKSVEKLLNSLPDSENPAGNDITLRIAAQGKSMAKLHEEYTSKYDHKIGYKAWLNGNSQNLTNNGGNDVVAAVSALGYDAYMTAVAAIEKAQSTDGTAIRDALAGLSIDAVTGSISFDANGDAIKSTAYIKQAIDGGFQFYKVQNAD